MLVITNKSEGILDQTTRENRILISENVQAPLGMSVTYSVRIVITTLFIV